MELRVLESNGYVIPFLHYRLNFAKALAYADISRYLRLTQTTDLVIAAQS